MNFQNLAYIVVLVVLSLIAFAIEWLFFRKQDNEPGSFFSRRSSQIRIAGLIKVLPGAYSMRRA
jgi:hypothetical protein